MGMPTLVLALLLLGSRTVYAQGSAQIPDGGLFVGPPTPYGQQILLAPGDSAERIFGTLLIRYRLSRAGTTMQCTLYVATQLAGIRQLSASTPTYSFDIEVTYGKANGTLLFQPASPQQGKIATLAGSFDYSSGVGQMFTFKGDLIGWYSPP